MSVSEPPAGPRSSRRTANEIFQMLISMGQEIVLLEGLGTGIDSLTFKRVLQGLKDSRGVTLTHASFIGRVFKSQADYQEQVLAMLVDGIRQSERDEVVNATLPLLEKVDLNSLASRFATLLEVGRVGAVAEIASITTSPSWPVWLSVVAAEASPRRSRTNQFRLKLREIVRAETDEFKFLYGEILSFLGMRMKSPYQINDLTVAIGALAEGVAIRSFIEPEVFSNVTLADSRDGASSEWTTLGLGIRALTEMMVEPDPTWVSPESEA